MRRVSVLGGSCSGKTTLSRQLAAILGVPHVELDALHHGPNWEEAPAGLLQERVRAALAAAPEGWVVDGSYYGKLGSLVLEEADTAVFLDPPFGTVIRRSLWRTFSRALARTELWNGNRETFRNAFSRYSIPMWVLRTHHGQRRKWAMRLDAHPQLEVVRLRSPGEVRRWLQSIQPTERTSGSSNGSELQKTPPLRET
jgi:adenylate kinase family enzyme